MKLRNLVALLVLSVTPLWIWGQNDGGRLSGNLELNGNFYIRDSLIGAANIPQYDHQLFGADAWLNLNYSNWGFDFGLRLDVFNNSQLLNPQSSYTAQGIGRWYVRKSMEKLTISGWVPLRSNWLRDYFSDLRTASVY
jgi:hypothetical protein